MRGLEQLPWLYDLVMAVYDRTTLRHERAWLAGGSRGRVLDLGCGTGRHLPLFDRCVRVVAVDPCAEMLHRARRRATDALCVRARAEALPFRDGVFDGATCGLVFCSVDDPHAGLRELRRVLHPAGALRMIEHVRATHPWHARLQDWLHPAWRWFTGGCHLNRDTEAAIVRAGFTIDAASRRARRTLRFFVARPLGGAP